LKIDGDGESVLYNRWLGDDVIYIRTRWLDKGETVNSTILVQDG